MVNICKGTIGEIVKMICTAKIRGAETDLAFRYDEWLISQVRGIQGRKWDKERRVWIIPTARLQEAKDIFIRNGHAWQEEKEYVRKAQPPVAPLNFEYKTEPFPHQRDGVARLVRELGGVILGDDMGIGKTKQIIDTAVHLKKTKGVKHCLVIVCVDILKWNWTLNQIPTHSDEKSYILGTRYRKNGKFYLGTVKDRYEDLKDLPNNDAFFIVTNKETLRYGTKIYCKDKRDRFRAAQWCENHGMMREAAEVREKAYYTKLEFCDEVIKLVKKGEIGLIAVDEAHKCKNPASQQGAALLTLAETGCVIPITGTPLLKDPMDLYLPLRLIGKEKHSYYEFEQHYCVKNDWTHRIESYRNLGELEELLDTCMIRRLKKDVLLDLPEMLPSYEYVEMSKAQADIYEEALMNIRNNIDQIKRSVNPLAQLLRLRQATGWTGILSSKVQESAKITYAEDLVQDEIANGGKVLILSNWTSVTRPVYDIMSKYSKKVAYITGEVKDKYSQQELFQTDEDCKVCIGTTGAMGVGIDLFKASLIIFLDEPWTQGDKDQARDRAYRQGLTHALRIVTLITKDTIDERVADIVRQRGGLANRLVDGSASIEDKAKLVDFLLS